MKKANELPLSDKLSLMLGCISKGENLTKLDIKNATNLSMSTIISGVDKLAEMKLISFATKKSANGGKPHSIININLDKYLLAITYKSGVLVGVMMNLRAQVTDKYESQVISAISPKEQLLQFVHKITPKDENLLEIILSVNCRGIEEVADIFANEYGAPCKITSNVVSMGWLRRKRTNHRRVASIGIGTKVKCAFLESNSRVIDVGKMPSPIADKNKILSYEQVLSAPEVSERIANKKYRGNYAFEAGFLVESADVSTYADMVALTLGSLIKMIDIMLAPQEIYLFSEYCSRDFFRRVMERCDNLGANVALAEDNKANFAIGAGLQALGQDFFVSN